jgi:hypothetical protein
VGADVQAMIGENPSFLHPHPSSSAVAGEGRRAKPARRDLRFELACGHVSASGRRAPRVVVGGSPPLAAVCSYGCWLWCRPTLSNSRAVLLIKSWAQVRGDDGALALKGGLRGLCDGQRGGGGGLSLR